MLNKRFGLWMSSIFLWIVPIATLASALDKNLIKVGKEIKTAGEGGKKLPELIGAFINTFLSVLGVIFVVLVVYAGYLWMTDAGGGKKIETAKKLLAAAIVGLVLIVASYAISAFVIDKVSDSTMPAGYGTGAGMIP